MAAAAGLPSTRAFLKASTARPATRLAPPAALIAVLIFKILAGANAFDAMATAIAEPQARAFTRSRGTGWRPLQRSHAASFLRASSGMDSIKRSPSSSSSAVLAVFCIAFAVGIPMAVGWLEDDAAAVVPPLVRVTDRATSAATVTVRALCSASLIVGVEHAPRMAHKRDTKSV